MSDRPPSDSENSPNTSSSIEEFKRVSRVFAGLASGALFFGATFVSGLVGDFHLTDRGQTFLWLSVIPIFGSLLAYGVAEWNVLSLTIYKSDKPTAFSLFLGLIQFAGLLIGVLFFAIFLVEALQEGEVIVRVPSASPTAQP